MILFPRKTRENNETFSTSYFGGKVVYDGTQKQMSEIEKKYQPYISKMNSLIKEIDTEIKKSERRAREILEAFPKKVEIETESTKNRTSLYTTKMNAIKMIMGAIKDIKDTELKEQKMVHEMTGKVVDVKGGNTMMKASIAGLIDSQMNREPKALSSIPSYGGSILGAPTSTIPKQEEPSYPEVEERDENGNVEYSGTPETKAGFTSLFGKVENPDKSQYLQGNNELTDYQAVDNRFSYGAAQTGLRNRFINDTEVKCHWDDDEKIGWLRTYDKKTGNIVSEEALIPPSYHGVLNIVNSGGMRYAISETEETYDLVPDSIKNVPEGIKEDLLNTYKRQDLK